MKKLKVLTVVGTRPEIIRLSRVVAALNQHCEHILVHTGQNYDYELNEVFFEVNSSENLNEISKILAEEGKTDVNIRMVLDEKILEFKIKNSRKLDRKSINLLRKREISSTIN